MKQTKMKSHAGTSLPPTGSMPAVNSNRGKGNPKSCSMSRDEGRFKRPDCAHMKSYGKTLNICTWNVRTLNMLGKLENLEREAESMQIDIMGLSETRYTDEGRIHLDNYVFLYSGGAEHHHGVEGASVGKAVLILVAPLQLLPQ